MTKLVAGFTCIIKHESDKNIKQNIVKHYLTEWIIANYLALPITTQAKLQTNAEG